MDFDLGAAGFSGVLLAGGTAARMDGIDKASIELGGRTLLEICLDAFLDADEVVVVGPRTVRTTRPVTLHARGPAAGRAGRRDCSPVSTCCCDPPRLIGVLAVDMPRVSAHTFRRLRDASRWSRRARFLTTRPGGGSCAAYSTPTALGRVRPDLEGQHGMSLRALLADLDLAAVAPVGDEARDIDTWADLRDLDE